MFRSRKHIACDRTWDSILELPVIEFVTVKSAVLVIEPVTVLFMLYGIELVTVKSAVLVIEPVTVFLCFMG